jgi:WD40 repeat protein
MTLDGIQFIQSFSQLISKAALHTYISALSFTSPATLLYQTYIAKPVTEQPLVVLNTDETWSCSRILREHAGEVKSIAFFPDSSKMISSSKDTTIRMWDTRTGRPIGDPQQNTGNVYCATVSPDGSQIASCSWNEIRLRDVDAGGHLDESLRGHTHKVRWVAYSLDGSRIASCSDDCKIRVWDANTGEEIGIPLAGHTNNINCVAFSRDGTLASASSDRTVRIWDIQNGYATLHGHGGQVLSVAWSPDATLLASGSADHLIHLWEGQTRGLIFELQGHISDVTSVAFSPDGLKLASASEDKTIRLWDTRTGHCIGNPLQGHDTFVQCVAFTPDGQHIASGSGDRTIRIWSMKQSRKIRIRITPLLKGFEDPASNTADVSSAPQRAKDLASSYADYVDEDGWACTCAGRKVVWVPIPRGKITVESDSLMIEGQCNPAT